MQRGEGQFGGQMGHTSPWGHGGYQNAQPLEDEVQRLSQMVLDMQARMTDMYSNLRLDFQEDASKMLGTLLGSVRQPASARGPETQTFQVQNLSFGGEPTLMDEVMNKISQVADDLDSKSNTLNDLVGHVSRHDKQIHLLMEADQNHLSTPLPAPPTNDADLRDYLDEKIRALRREMMEGMDIKLADLKNSCDYKILSVKEECEGQEANYLSLAELMDSKETDLRSEIQDLKNKLVGPGKEDSQVSDSVLARVENLEIRLNSSEKTTAIQCLSVEEKLRIGQAEAFKDLRETLEDKLVSMEDRLTNVLVEPSTNSLSGGNPEHEEALQSDLNSLQGSVHSLEDRFDVLDQLCSRDCNNNATVFKNIQQDFQSCITAVETSLRAMEGHHLNYSTSIESMHGELIHLKGRVDSLEDSGSVVVPQPSPSPEREAKDLADRHSTQGRELRTRPDDAEAEAGQAEDVGKEIAHMDSRIARVESLCGKLDPISASLHRIKEDLNTQLSALWNSVYQLNSTVGAHAQDTGGLRGTSQSQQALIFDVTGDGDPGKKGKL